MPERLYFDGAITPNRSLPIGGFKVLLGLMVALNLVLAAVFWAMGALPVPIFLGLDVLALFIAFRVSYRSARQQERVQVSAEEVRVLHQLGEAARVMWRSPTAFTRVEVDHPGQHETRVRVTVSGKSWSIGRALSPDERGELARALDAAIRTARKERYTDP